MKKYILIIIVSFFLISCGSRKAVVDNTKKDSSSVEVLKEKDSTTIDKVVQTNFDLEVCEYTIQPIDSTKEFVVNGKKYFNAKISIKKTKDNTLHVEKEKVSQIKEKQYKKEIKKSVKVKNKTTEKKESYFSFLLLLILLLILYLAYRWRKLFRIIL